MQFLVTHKDNQYYGWRYSIIKLEGKRGGKLKPLSEMWDDIKKELTFQKQQQAIDEMIGRLSRDAKIDVYEGEIK